MNLLKFISDGFGVGFLFGLAAYDEITEQHGDNNLTKVFRSLLWAILFGVAYQYAFSNNTKPENKALFAAGVTIGVLSAEKQKNNKS